LLTIEKSKPDAKGRVLNQMNFQTPLIRNNMKQYLAILIVLATIVSSCKKDKEDKKQVTLPKLTTAAITNLSFNTATSGGTITGDGGGAITASGICWSKTNNTPTLSDSKITGTTATGSYSFVMTNLDENTTYYVRAFATNSAGTGYGNVVTFSTTIDVKVPQLTTAPITGLAYNTATSGGTIATNGGAAITTSGICWSKTNNTPTLADSTKAGTTASGSFTFVMNNLDENTTYYVRAFATNSAGTGYGDVVTFTTPVNVTLPLLTTATITGITYNSATSGGTITADGGGVITASGICWSKTNNPPTILDSKVEGTTATGSFASVMNSLEENTTYYVRAFATNSAGTGYGNVVTFTTLVNITSPVLTTATTTNISFTTATSGGTITTNGGAAITASGVCWSKTNNPPTIADSKISGTTASGSFSSAMTNLEQSTTYYVRAFATNSVGTGYGNVVTFTTTTDPNSVTFTYNGATVTYGIITSAVTGRQWMDRNLGASRVATASNDRMAYGHLFQWGRPADGHQLVNYTSSTNGAGVNGKTKTLATSDVPGNSLFITPDNTVEQNGVFVYDWRNDQNTNRWAINSQGSCPSGWHVPTTAEWEAETGITNLTTGFNQLKLTAAGFRYGDFDGSGREGTVRNAGSFGWYWSSSVWPSGVGFSSFKSIASNESITDLAGRAYGMPIRCIKN
jgi:uncharacterized protein (TIGR02145 family)